jgi:hypothetical protein
MAVTAVDARSSGEEVRERVVATQGANTDWRTR